MDAFQKTVLAVAAGCFVLVLVLSYYLMIRAEKTETWPPYVAQCPDYWDLSNNTTCMNTPKQTANGVAIANYSIAGQTTCQQYNWALSNNVPWDGITYGVNPATLSNLCQGTTS